MLFFCGYRYNSQTNKYERSAENEDDLANNGMPGGEVAVIHMPVH